MTRSNFNLPTTSFIIELDKKQLLQRFHGGAAVSRNTVRLGYNQKQVTAVEGKQRIGEEASNLIPNRSFIFLDVGTTVEAVANALAAHQHLHIFTNSLSAASALSSGSNRVYVLGGLLHGPDGSLVGGDVEAAVANFNFDFAVIACSGFNDNGEVMDFDIQKVGVKRAAMKNARHTLLVADSSKFQRTAFVCISHLEQFTYLITDQTPPEPLKTQIQSSGVEVIVP